MNQEPSKFKRTMMMIIGVLLMPLILCAYIVDRFVMVFMVLSDAPTIVDYFQDMKYIGISVLRTFVISLIVLFIWWLCK